MCPSSGADDCVMSLPRVGMCRGCREVVKSGWQVVRPWMGSLTTFLQPRHIPTQGYNITQSSAPDDGHMVARNMLSNHKKRNKEYKK